MNKIPCVHVAYILLDTFLPAFLSVSYNLLRIRSFKDCGYVMSVGSELSLPHWGFRSLLCESYCGCLEDRVKTNPKSHQTFQAICLFFVLLAAQEMRWKAFLSVLNSVFAVKYLCFMIQGCFCLSHPSIFFCVFYQPPESCYPLYLWLLPLSFDLVGLYTFFSGVSWGLRTFRPIYSHIQDASRPFLHLQCVLGLFTVWKWSSHSQLPWCSLLS